MKLTQAQLQRIQALESKAGRLSARRRPCRRKDKRSPLHSLLQLEPASDVALEKAWLQQSQGDHRRRSRMQVVHTRATMKAPAYVVDTTVKGGGYRSVVALNEDKTSARQSLIYTLETAAGHSAEGLRLGGFARARAAR
jgi:hypothetical protein